MESSEDPERSPGGPRAFQGSPEGAPEEHPGVLRAPLGIPCEDLGGSFATRIDDLDSFLSVNHAPKWADDGHLKK